MNAIWVVQNCRDGQTKRVVDALDNTKSPYILADIDYSTGTLIVPPAYLGVEFIPYGSTSLTKVAQERGWRYSFYNDNFNVNVYKTRHSRMLNNDFMIMSLPAVKMLATTQDQWFVRPVDDDKAFAGHVCTSLELQRWITQLENHSIAEVANIKQMALASVKPIQMEWRYFIVDGTIISGSVYRRNGESLREREDDLAVINEAQALANLWLPHPCCVMDVALCDDTPYVIEFNTLNAAGFYDHNIEAVVTAVNKVASS